MTWFKKFLAYRLTDTIDLSPQTLQSALESKLAREPGSDELSTYGFSTPLPRVDGPLSKVLAHPCGTGILVCTEKWIRRVPGKAVDKELDEQARKIEESQGRKVKGRERSDLKQAIIQSMLPSIVPDCKHTTALILPNEGLILVDTATSAQAEDLLSCMREVLGSLPLRPMRTVRKPADVMTAWLKEGRPAAGLSFLDNAVLVSQVEGQTGKARLTKMDLTSEEVQLHISAGRRASHLGLAWEDKVTFRVTDKLAIESIKLSELLSNDVLQANGEGDALQHFDGSMVIMASTLGALVSALAAAFGGEDLPEASK